MFRHPRFPEVWCEEASEQPLINLESPEVYPLKVLGKGSPPFIVRNANKVFGGTPINRNWVVATEQTFSMPRMSLKEAYSETLTKDIQPAGMLDILLEEKQGRQKKPFKPQAFLMPHPTLKADSHLVGDALRPYLVCGGCLTGWTWLDSQWTCCSFCGGSFLQYELRFHLWPGGHTSEAAGTLSSYKGKGKGTTRLQVNKRAHYLINHFPEEDPRKPPSLYPTNWKDLINTQRPPL